MLAVLLLASPAHATRPDSLDISFSRDGKRVVNFGQAEVALEVLAQPDGKIVLAGSQTDYSTSSNYVLARLYKDGGDFAVARYDQ